MLLAGRQIVSRLGTSASSSLHRCSQHVISRRPRAACAAKKSRKQKSSKKLNRNAPSGGFAADDLELPLEPIVPPSAPPTSANHQQDPPAPQQIYPVFKEEASVRRIGGAVSGSGGRWRWDDAASDDDSDALDVQPSWNPRTGFTIPEGQQPEYVPQVDLTGVAAAEGEDLPPVTKQQVYGAALGTAFWMTVVALLVRAYAEQNAPLALGTDPQLLRELLSFQVLSPQQGVVLLVTAAAVTGARWGLLRVWPEFASASYRSNKQVLTVLSPMDTLAVSCATALSEELLFRGALIPATAPDWRGLLVSAAVFGVLHNSGGRNMAFAAWSTAVGGMYGAVFLLTHNIWVPVGAHALGNLGSAALFWDKYSKARLVGRE